MNVRMKGYKRILVKKFPKTDQRWKDQIKAEEKQKETRWETSSYKHPVKPLQGKVKRAPETRQNGLT